jgi:hypothetical protein
MYKVSASVQIRSIKLWGERKYTGTSVYNIQIINLFQKMNNICFSRFSPFCPCALPAPAGHKCFYCVPINYQGIFLNWTRSPLNGYFCRLDKPMVTSLKIIYKICNNFSQIIIIIYSRSHVEVPKYMSLWRAWRLKIIVFCFMSLRRLSDPCPLVFGFNHVSASYLCGWAFAVTFFSEFSASEFQIRSAEGTATRVLKWPTRVKKGPIYTRTRQINYY